MPRLMLDSTVAADIPEGYQGRSMELVAGYIDGPHTWTETDWKRFPPTIRQVRICIYNGIRPGFPDPFTAQVIDIQPRNNDAKGSVPWIRGKWARGQVPTAYCFSDSGPTGFRISDIRRECDTAGVKRPLFWIAHWGRRWEDFDPAGDPSIIALQYDGSSETLMHFDASAVASYWPDVDPDPSVKLAVAPEHVLPAIYLQRMSLGYNAWTGDPIDPKGELPDYAKPPVGWEDPYK